MAQNITLATIVADIRARGEFRTNPIDDTVLGRWVNQSVAHLYDIMIAGDCARVPMSQGNVTVASGTQSYDLATAGLTDYYHLLRVDVLDGSEYYRLEPFMVGDPIELIDDEDDKFSTRYHMRGGVLWLSQSPTWSGTLRLTYVPVAPTIVDGATPVLLDSKNQWQEWVVLDCCIKLGAMDNHEAVPIWLRERDRVERRILKATRNDRSSARTLFLTRQNRARDARELYRLRRR